MNMLIEFNFINRGNFINPHSNHFLKKKKTPEIRFSYLSPSLYSINYLIRTYCFRDKTPYPIFPPT